MTKKDVIDKVEDIDDLELEIETSSTPEVKEKESLDDIPDLSDKLPKDEVKEELNKEEEIEFENDDDIPSGFPLTILTKLEDSKPEKKEKQETLQTLENKPVIETKQPDTSSTLPIEKESKEGAKEHKKRGRPKAEIKTTVENTLHGTYHPLFEITKIKSTKYQSRKTLRTKEQTADLANKIKDQGQLEPVHIHLENGEYQLVAGFGRFEAILSLQGQTVKAIVYEGLSEEDLMTYSFGTNEGRLELSPLDKIYSVGEFAKAHPTLKEDDIAKIFGYGKSSIYKYTALFEYFSRNENWLKYFKENNFPISYFEKIKDRKTDIKSVESLIDYLKQSKFETELDFAVIFNKFFVKESYEEQLKEKIKEIQTPDESNPDNIPLDLEEKTRKELGKAQNTQEEILKTQIAELLHELKTHLNAARKVSYKILSIESFKCFIQVEDLKTLNNVSSEISKTLVKFV